MNAKLFGLLTLVFLHLSCNNLIAQRDSINFKGNTSVFLQLFGPELLGIHVNVNLSSRISLNAGLGVGLSYHIGSNFYFPRKDTSELSRFYIGMQGYSIKTINPFAGGFNPDGHFGVYIPFGWDYIYAKNNFSFQIDIGPNFSEDLSQINTGSVNVSIKLGKIF